MKEGLKQIIGKKISGAVVAENKGREPKLQVFLEFDDGTHFEFYGNQFNSGGGENLGGFEAIARYVERAGGKVMVRYRAEVARSVSTPQRNNALGFRVDGWSVLWALYWLGNLATFAKLTFFSAYRYNGWNWIIALPINEFLGAIWPLYWTVIRPFFGA